MGENIAANMEVALGCRRGNRLLRCSEVCVVIFPYLERVHEARAVLFAYRVGDDRVGLSRGRTRASAILRSVVTQSRTLVSC
jgi:hypothetical protein